MAPALPEPHRVAILVLGMHRSGTSALTWLLGQMGAALPRDPIGAHAENAKGYWESAALVQADDRLIRAAGSSWFDPRPPEFARVPPPLLAERLDGVRHALRTGWGAAPLLAIKDPRLCRLLPRFTPLLAEEGIAPRAVLMLRPAAEVAASIHRRDATVPAYGQLLWLRHMLEAERDSRAMPRAVVRYGDLLSDWRGMTARIAPLLGVAAWAPTDGGAAVDAFLDPALNHAAGPAPALPAALGTLVAAAEAAFDRLWVADDATAHTALDAVAARLAAQPWIEGDIVHDELRHRRAPAPTAPDDPPAPPPPPAPAATVLPLAPAADPSGDAALIRASGLFDAEWYRATYPDVDGSGLDPVDHYLRQGAARGYRPNPLFDTAYYARQLARRLAVAS